MIDPQAKPAAYIKLLALVAVLGVGSAVITFVFMVLVQQGTALIWEQAAAMLGVDLRLFTIVVCTIGGLLVGRFFETLYKFPSYTPHLVDLLYAVPLGLVGGAVGLLFMLSLKLLQQMFAPMMAHVALRGLVGGLSLGIIGSLLSLYFARRAAQRAQLVVATP